MWRAFKEDAARWVTPEQIAPIEEMKPGKILRLLYTYMSLRAMLIWRFAGWCKQKRIPFLFGFLNRSLMVLYGLELCKADKIEGGLYIAHPVGVVIDVTHMGKNATIIGSVTIGTRATWEFPVIGERFFAGVGSRILGGIHIGDNVKVGANAVVIEDVPDGGIVVGIPARLIKIYDQPVAQTGEKVRAG